MNKSKSILCGFLFVLCYSCAQDKVPTVRDFNDEDAFKVSNSVEKDVVDDSEFESPSGLKVISVKGKVSPLRLDDGDFRVTGVRAGLQDFFNYSSPTIHYFSPEVIDYVEILRCKSNLIIDGFSGNIDDEMTKKMSKAKLKEWFKINHFWTSAEQAGCVYVSRKHIEKENYFDGTASSGSWRYLVRGCVDIDRISASTVGMTKRNCSAQIGISPVLKGYVNGRTRDQQNSLEQVVVEKARIDSLGKSMHANVVAYNNALVVCEKRERKKLIEKTKQEALGTVIGTGATLGLEFAGGFIAAKAASVGSEVFIGAMQSLQEGYMSMSSGMSRAFGTPLAGAINDIFSNPEQMPKSCTTANEIYMIGQKINEDLKVSSQLFAMKLQDLGIMQQMTQEIEYSP